MIEGCERNTVAANVRGWRIRVAGGIFGCDAWGTLHFDAISDDSAGRCRW